MVGLDILVNTANVFYLISYSVRDIFWLRLLSIVGALILLPYYYFQSSPLWTPIGWNVFFTSINVYWVIRLLLERRPVPFSETQRRLYELALRNFSERDAYSFLELGDRQSFAEGTRLLVQGEPVETLALIVSGEASVEMNGVPVDKLGEGRFLGGTAFLSDEEMFKAPVTVTSTMPVQVFIWKFAKLKSEFKKTPELEISVEASLGLEISRFLQSARQQIT